MTLNDRTKNLLSTLLRFALSAILLAYLYRKIDVVKTAEVVRSANLVFIGYALLSFLVIHMLLLSRE